MDSGTVAGNRKVFRRNPIEMSRKNRIKERRICGWLEAGLPVFE